jgi:hypothetical protein
MTYKHHNPEFVQPIMNKLIQTLGNKWSDSSYGDDCVASISRDIPNPAYSDYMTVLLPNSTKYNMDKEEINNYAVKCGDESDYIICETLEQTIEMVKRFESVIQSAKDMESEQADAKLLFAECEKIDPSECDAYDLEPTDTVEVHKCKATGWHYLYDPTAEVCPYYCCITINSGEFDTLEQLQKWARPLYFQ